MVKKKWETSRVKSFADLLPPDGNGAAHERPEQQPGNETYIRKGMLLSYALDISNGTATQRFEEILPDIGAGTFRNSMLVTLALSENASAQWSLLEHKDRFDLNLWMIAAARSATRYSEHAGSIRAACEDEILAAWMRHREEDAFAAIAAGLMLAGSESRGLGVLERAFVQWRSQHMDQCDLLVKWLDDEAKDLMGSAEGKVDAEKLELISAVFRFIEKGVKIGDGLRNEQAEKDIQREITKRLKPVRSILVRMGAVPPGFDLLAEEIAEQCIARTNTLKQYVHEVLAKELKEEMNGAMDLRFWPVVKIAALAKICFGRVDTAKFFNNVIDSNAPTTSKTFAKMFLAFMASENKMAGVEIRPGGAAEVKFRKGAGGSQIPGKLKMQS